MRLLSCPKLDAEIVSKLTRLAEMMAVAQDDWCLIGGAALALWGVPGVKVRDIDVILSAGDAEAILGAVGVPITTPAPNDLFRSTIYAQMGTGIQYDFMAEFAVNGPNGWMAVPPRPEYCMMFDEHAIWLPSTEELTRILKLFGRPKDVERLRLLAQISTSAP